MSDHSTPPAGSSGPDDGSVAPEVAADELASAYLDGMATPTEVARFEADDALIDVMGEFAQVSRAMVDDLPDLPPAAADAGLAAALAAFDERVAEGLDDDGASAAAVAPVTSLAERRPWYARAPIGAAAAAVVVVLVGAVAALSTGGQDDDADTAAMTEAAPSETRASGADDAFAADDMLEMDLPPMAEADAPTAAAPAAGSAAAPSLRIFDSSEELLDEFAQAYRGRTPPAAESSTADDAAADGDAADGDAGAGSDGESAEESSVESNDPCDAVRLLGFDPATVDLVARVEVDGELGTAVIDARPDGEGFRIGVVVDQGCRIVLIDDL